jgi:preprotein translocase subunit SecA
MFKLFSGLLDSNEKELKRLQPLVDKINELEAEYQQLTPEALRAKTAEFKARIEEATAKTRRQLTETQQNLAQVKQHLNEAQPGFELESATTNIKHLEETIKQLEEEIRKAKNEALNKLIPEAFAAVREAARRTIKQRHFDVQLLGGIALHQGKIAEMRTGEGKTLTATLPLYLNALTGDGCHLVTVNDYLARRDPNWMGPIYHSLGISVACIYSQTPDNQMPSFIYDPTYESPDKRWQLRPVTRKEAYEADITYGTNNEFGFDYLRDNMVGDLTYCVQRPLTYAIVDEVDNLLIDEARTPLIISGRPEKSEDAVLKEQQEKNAAQFVERLQGKKFQQTKPGGESEEDENGYDYKYYEKEQIAILTRSGEEKLANWFHEPKLYHDEELEEKLNKGEYVTEPLERSILKQRIDNALRAKEFFLKDQQYTVTPEGKVVIVDEFTGRLMYGRRYEGGLHEAIEAKEGIKTEQLSKTFATITFQNYFRMYLWNSDEARRKNRQTGKLAGMTGTALTEAEEFSEIYKLEVVSIPTNQEFEWLKNGRKGQLIIREDYPDQIYKNEKGKLSAVVNAIIDIHKKGQPILIGTVSIEKSENLCKLLEGKGLHKNIDYKVLNARREYLEKEADIHAEAGKPGAITVATNMAGRGVDIILGGKRPEDGDEKLLQEWQARHNQVVAAGGLHVIGTERHEARRIDNQLRGRSGRQGDPGSSRFFVSLKDDIVRRFGGDRVEGLMEWAGMGEETPIENSMISRMIADVQKRVEGYNFDIRKHLVEYDDVVNTQREIIYTERRKTLGGADLKSNILEMIDKELHNVMANHYDSRGYERDDAGLIREANTIFPLPRDFNADTLAKMQPKEIEKKLIETAHNLYEQREKEFGASDSRLLERLLMLKTIDSLWVEHLTTMEEERLQAGWAQLQQVKSVDAYKTSGFSQFQVLIETIQHDIAHTIFHVSIKRESKPAAPSAMAKASGRTDTNLKQPTSKNKIGRNDPCPCGSGKKYKHCCGK